MGSFRPSDQNLQFNLPEKSRNFPPENALASVEEVFQKTAV
jgi:hypothetical protein